MSNDTQLSLMEEFCVQLLATDIERVYWARRELHTALAHCMVKAKPGSPRMELLNRIYHGLSWNDNARCRAELTRCRRAIAFPQEAIVQ